MRCFPSSPLRLFDGTSQSVKGERVQRRLESLPCDYVYQTAVAEVSAILMASPTRMPQPVKVFQSVDVPDKRQSFTLRHVWNFVVNVGSWLNSPHNTIDDLRNKATQKIGHMLRSCASTWVNGTPNEEAASASRAAWRKRRWLVERCTAERHVSDAVFSRQNRCAERTSRPAATGRCCVRSTSKGWRKIPNCCG